MGWGQAVKVLEVGDRVPDIYLKNLVNYPVANASLSHFKKKLLILDFWATNCAACIREIPMLDSMQKIYSNELSVLMISSSSGDTKEKVQKVFGRINSNKGVAIQLPVLLGDTIINQMFPHSYIPHFALLDSNLKVLAITGDEGMNVKKLEAVLKNKSVDFSKKPGLNEFNSNELLFAGNSGNPATALMHRSTLSGFLTGAPSATFISKDSAGRVTRLLLTNQTMLDLLKRAYEYFVYPASIQWPDETGQMLNPKGRPRDWIVANSYTYELITPAIAYDSARRLMQLDLERYFGYAAEIKPVAFKCYLLQTDSTIAALNQFQLSNITNPSPEGQCSLAAAMSCLEKMLGAPVLNESTFSNQYTIILSHADTADLVLLQQALAARGICLTETTRKARTLFIYQLSNKLL